MSSTTADQNSTLVASTRSGLRACSSASAALLERLGDLVARRAELACRAPQHAGARVLGAVDAVAEAHQALAAVERVLDPARRRRRARSTSSSICSTREGAPPCSGPLSAPTALESAAAHVGAGRGDDAGGEGRGVHAVLGGRDPVGVDRLDVRRGRPRRASGSGSARRSSCPSRSSVCGTHGWPSPRADCATKRQRHHRGAREVVARLLVGDVEQLAHAPLGREHRERRPARRRAGRRSGPSAGAARPAAARARSVPSTSRPQTFSNGTLPDEVLDVDAAVAQRAALLVGLGDLGGEGDDAFQAGLDLGHVRLLAGAGFCGVRGGANLACPGDLGPAGSPSPRTVDSADPQEEPTMTDAATAADLMFRPASELADLVRAGEITARELVEASLSRIDALNPDLQRLHRRLPRRGAARRRRDQARRRAPARRRADRDQEQPPGRGQALHVRLLVLRRLRARRSTGSA